jgi:muskelin
MLLDPNTRILYIFAGQREGSFLSDMHTYDLKTYTATEIFSDSAAIGGPSPSFAQRAVIDPDLKEIYV